MTADAAARAVPYHCPFCAEEDLHPRDEAPGAWHCRTCLRVFSVRFLGLANHAPAPAAPRTTEGGPR